MFGGTEYNLFNIDNKLRAINQKTDHEDDDTIVIRKHGGHSYQKAADVSQELNSFVGGAQKPATTHKELVGYEEVPRGRWNAIALGDYVRYVKTDGTIVRGGILISHLKRNNVMGFRIQFIAIKNKNFVVYYDTIKQVYRKAVNHTATTQETQQSSAPAAAVERRVGGTVMQVPQPDNVVSQVGDRILFGNQTDTMEERIARLEKTVAQLKRIIHLMHNKITAR